MSPDIEWHIGEESEQETVVKAQSKPPRWNRILIGLVVIGGAGLGLAYSRLPEPSRLGAPTAVPTEMPLPLPPLTPVVEREAHALADDDWPAFFALQDPNDAQWQQIQQASFRAWSMPQAQDQSFTILNSGVIQPNRGWADVIQYRNGQYFRETRFYRAYRDSWVRTSPDLSAEFWGDLQTDQTTHFTLIYSARDADQAHQIANQWERTYTQVCSELSCTGDLATPAILTINIQPRPDTPRADRSGFRQDQGRAFGLGFGFGFGVNPSQGLTLTLPSPSLIGLYYNTLDMSVAGQNPRLDSSFDRSVLPYIVYLASGGPDRWSDNPDGLLFVTAISNWLRTQLGDQTASQPAPQRAFNSNFFSQQRTLSLTDLWSVELGTTQWQRQLAVFEANALIQFINQTYGADIVLKFFHGLRDARSLSNLIETLGLPYSDFEAKWMVWLDQVRANT